MIFLHDTAPPFCLWLLHRPMQDRRIALCNKKMRVRSDVSVDIALARWPFDDQFINMTCAFQSEVNNWLTLTRVAGLRPGCVNGRFGS